MYAFWNSTFKVLLVSEIYNNGLKEYILPLYLISFVQNYICTCVPHPDYNIVISLQLNFKKLKKLTKKNLKIVFVKFIQIVACRLSLLIFFFLSYALPLIIPCVYLIHSIKWQPTPVLLPGKFHWWRSLVGYSPWGHKESDTTELLH